MSSAEPRDERTLLGAGAGLVSAVVALGAAELAAAGVRPKASPVVAVGGSVIDATPVWLKDFAIRTFGENDKPVLLASIVAVLLLLALVAGALAVRRLAFGIAGVALLGLVGAAAAAARPGAQGTDVLPSLLGAVLGSAALVVLTRRLRGTAADSTTGSAGRTTVGSDRRQFLLTGFALAVTGIAAGGAGRLVNASRSGVAAARTALRLPAPTSPALPVPPGTDLRVPGLSPFRTPNAQFYRVDTALLVPQVSPGEWRLRIHGMVDREIELTFDQLLERDLIERDITLTCVSNEVGGQYVGTARWLGAPLAALLQEAGIHRRADMLLSRSVDGMTISTPTAVVMDGRDALLAVGMNGAPLPATHGFPVRMVVPGLYGYVSATKWLVELELTRFDRTEAYWTERGWAPKAPIRTMSRIDTPKASAVLTAGRVAIAGVAWAQHRGIDRVEVRVDEGLWQEARLAPVPSTDTWRQWVWAWDAVPGRHQIEVRATDRAGQTQTADRADPFPSGATGWHSTVVTVA